MKWVIIIEIWYKAHGRTRALRFGTRNHVARRRAEQRASEVCRGSKILGTGGPGRNRTDVQGFAGLARRFPEVSFQAINDVFIGSRWLAQPHHIILNVHRTSMRNFTGITHARIRWHRTNTKEH